MIQSAPIINAKWKTWIGAPAAETESDLPFDANVKGGKIQVAHFDGFDPTKDYTKSFAIGIKPDRDLGSTLQAIDAKITKIHGQIPGVDLLAAAAATYTAPIDKITGTIDSNLTPTSYAKSTNPDNTIDLDWQATPSEYAYLYLQLRLQTLGGTPLAFTFSQQEGESGIIYVNGNIATGIKAISGMAAGDAKDLILHANKVDFFVEDDDGLQLMGCYEKEFTCSVAEEYTDMTKGDPAEVVSTKLTSSSFEISGMFSALTPYNAALLLNATIDDTDPTYYKIKKGDGVYPPTKFVGCWLRCRYNGGRIHWIYVPSAVGSPDGDWVLGADDGTKFGWRLKALGAYELWYSRNIWQLFTLGITYTQP